MRATWLIALLLAALAGCDSKPKEPAPDLVKSQRDAMDKAKGVGDTLQKSADERRKQSEQAGGDAK
jgi:hypothetical protein